tara:strand:+ start:645 stop:884 length:240 start_codon:yes stop_codon:yes gene_type:complete
MAFEKFNAGDLVAMRDKHSDDWKIGVVSFVDFEYFMVKVIWSDRMDAEWISEQKIYPYKMVAEQIKDWRSKNDRDKDEE